MVFVIDIGNNFWGQTPGIRAVSGPSVGDWWRSFGTDMEGRSWHRKPQTLCRKCVLHLEEPRYSPLGRGKPQLVPCKWRAACWDHEGRYIRTYICQVFWMLALTWEVM